MINESIYSDYSLFSTLLWLWPFCGELWDEKAITYIHIYILYVLYIFIVCIYILRAAIVALLSKRTWSPQNVWLISIFVKMLSIVMQEVQIIPGQGPLHTQECLNGSLFLCFDRKSPSVTFKLCQECSGATAAMFNEILLQNGAWLLEALAVPVLMR